MMRYCIIPIVISLSLNGLYILGWAFIILFQTHTIYE